MNKIWRSGKVVLVEHGEDFSLIDETGAITRRFTPTEWSIDDELGNCVYVIADTMLVARTTTTLGFSAPRIKDEVELRDLVPATDPDTVAFVAAVLGDDAVSREERRLRLAREGELRVAAIAGARRDHGLGDDFARAQHALVEHVHAYDDALYAALLRTLLALARARASRAAISAYVRACLLACFAHTLPEHVDGTPVSAPTLADELEVRAKELEQRADGQEWVDANANARQYRAAAAAARMAAKLLT